MTSDAPARELRLDLEGMTCASCAARIEKTLNRLDGVEATVNYATEQATIRCDDAVSDDQLVGAVESIGYHAHLAEGHHHDDLPATALSRRLAVAVALTVPTALLGMVQSLQFSGWEWVALVLSTPVVFYAGRGFHQAALKNALHRSASMDTLISIGTLAAWTWSAVIVIGGLEGDTYFEAAA